MIPPRQIQMPTAPDTVGPALLVWVKLLYTRLTNWVAQVGQSFQSQVQRQVVVTLTGPTGAIPFTLDVDTDGTPRAELVADGAVLLYVSGAPAVGQWSLPVISNVPTITFNTAPTVAWFTWLVAR